MTEPSPTALLTPIFGAYTASIISLLAFVGYIITWVAPLLPPPAPTANPGWKFVYAVISKIGGNVGYAKNKDPEPVAGQYAQPSIIIPKPPST